ncbi:MAG: iron-sulfur cluster assembly protein, partial [Gammaproteobacteria bacterium]
MPADLESQVWDALKAIRYPGMSRDIVSFGFVQRVAAAGGAVTVELQMSTHHPEAAEQVRDEVER